MSDLSSFVDMFSKLKVMCIGDVMLDDFVYGEVTRISPEAPVPVLKQIKNVKKLGGAANVTANITSLGAKSFLIGIRGDDAAGKEMSDMLKENGCISALFTAPDFSTTVKTRMVCGNQHLFRWDIEQTNPIPDSLVPEVRKQVQKWIQGIDIIILSDYNKGFLSPALCQAVIKEANRCGKKVLVDPKGNDCTKYSGAYMMTPNLKEFCQITKTNLHPSEPDFQEKIKAAADILFKSCKLHAVIVTLSEYGMIYIPANKNEKLVLMPTKAKEVFDVTGAGDTVIAALALSLAANADIVDAMSIANSAAGIVVSKFGICSVFPCELKDSLSINSFEDSWKIKKKIITVEQAKKISAELKATGKKIGFTNGCFDLLHLGHLHSFLSAREKCDVLFVGLNSDESVRRLKGETRPVQNELTRSVLLACLETIDYVILFDDDTAVKLVDAIRPDIIAKQGYSMENWPEAQKVKEMGGEVVILEKLEGYSTTSLIAKMGK